MTLSPGFLHGEQALVGFLLAGLIALVGIPLLLYVWLRHTKISELKLSVGYLILMVVLCGGVLVSSGPNDPATIISVAVFGLGFILTLPWNLITMVVIYTVNSSIDDREFALLMLLGAGINAVLVYFIAKKMRRSIR